MSNNDLIFVNNDFGLCALQVGVDPLVRQRVWEHILEVANILNILEVANILNILEVANILNILEVATILNIL